MKLYKCLNKAKILLLLFIFASVLSVEGQNFGYTPIKTDTIISTRHRYNNDESQKDFHYEFGLTLFDKPNFEYLSTFFKLPDAKSIERDAWYAVWGLTKYDTFYTVQNIDFVFDKNYFFKFHWQNNAVRLSYEFNNLTYKDVVDSTYWNTTILGWFKVYEGKYNINKFSLGYERNYPYKTIDFFYAIDFAYYFGSITGSTYRGYGNPGLNYTPYPEYDYEIKLNEYSVAPTVGFRIHFLRICAVTAEMNFNILYYTAKDTKNHFPNTSKTKIYTNPFRLFSIGMYF